MAYLEREDGRRVYYEDLRGPGLPVMLIHGWAMSGRIWDAVTGALTQAGHRVITFDQRGCGLSDKDFTDSSVAALAGDAVALAEALGLTSVVLNGWSLGGAVAAEAAARLGSRCAGLILTCAASPRYTRSADFEHGGTTENVLATVAAAGRNRAVFMRGVVGAVCAIPQEKPTEDWMWSLFMQSTPCADASLADLAHLDQRELLKGLATPVLAIAGGKDVFTPPAIGEAAAALAPKGRLVILTWCGHAPFIEEFDDYMHAVRGFLGELA